MESATADVEEEDWYGFHLEDCVFIVLHSDPSFLYAFQGVNINLVQNLNTSCAECDETSTRQTNQYKFLDQNTKKYDNEQRSEAGLLSQLLMHYMEERIKKKMKRR